jgi:exodeoxyribonuclease VII large subunit
MARAQTAETRRLAEGRRRLDALALRLDAAPAARLAALTDRLGRLDRMRQTLGYRETLSRGFAVVRGDGVVVTSQAAARRAQALEIEFSDGRLPLSGPPRARQPQRRSEDGQPDLFNP